MNNSTTQKSLPPRPNAIATLITSTDFLPGSQTVLYSIQKNLKRTSSYPPEIIILTTINDESFHKSLKKNCHRIITIPFIPSPQKSHVASWDTKCGFSKLAVFKLQEYDQILYIDSDCIVLEDVSHLFKNPPEVIAAVPDFFPPDKFNAGVLHLRPSLSLYESIMEKFRNNFSSYDGGDTGFLNDFFGDWYEKKEGRLSFKYNAQRYMYDVTYKKQSGYWDKGVGKIAILHFSSYPKPWEKKKGDHKLDDLWWTWYENSKKSPIEEDKKKDVRKTTRRGNDNHDEVAKRFKELRKEGKAVKEAMEQARRELGVIEEGNAGNKVAAMFGLA